MKRIYIAALSIVLLGLLESPLRAATVNAASCSSTDVQNAINSASNGSTVAVPGGTCAWSALVSIPNTKGITLDGGGATINGGITLTPNSTSTSRITNFTFTKNGDNTYANAALGIRSAGLNAARWRVDHCAFTGNGSNIIFMEESPGLFDHNSVTGGQAADEIIHLMGWGAGNNTGWTTNMPSSSGSRASGTDEAIFFEDNTFSSSSYSNTNPAWIQSYYGARVVYRYNVFNYFKVDAHGNTDVGTRWWEFYNNDFHATSAGNAGGFSMTLRAGSGIIFNNTYSGDMSPQAQIGLCEEDAVPYPADYQIGRGTGTSGNEMSDPAYTWNNSQSVSVNSCEGLAKPGLVAFNRDVYTSVNSASCTAGGSCTSGLGSGTVLPATCTAGVGFWKTDAGGNWDTTHGGANDGALYKCTSTNVWTQYYTPYTYPHPMASGQAPPPPPPPPPGGDTTPPSVTLSIAGGTSVSGTSVTVTGTASDNVGVAGVQFKLDGINLNSEDTSAPYSLTWNSTTVANGVHTLTAVARDAAGNTTTSTALLVTVNNAVNLSTAIIDPGRSIQWSPGVPGGIPSRTNICATVNADKTGTNDASGPIQTAINGCPQGQVVLIPAGTYRLNSQISIAKGISVRCANPLTTFLQSYADWHAVQFGNFPAPPVATNVSGSPAKGATTISVASISSPSLSVGDYFVIDQLNDGIEVINVDDESRDGNMRSLREIKKISAINSLTITFSPPLYHNYSAALTPQVWKLNEGNAMTVRAGLEDCSLERVSPTGFEGYSNIKIVNCVECWVKDVTSIGAQFRHVDLDRSYKNEIRDSYFHDGQHYDTGGYAYGVVSAASSADNLIENNVFRHLRHAMVVKEGASGNVYAYNYSIEAYQGENWLGADLNSHGAHTQFNLFEGNIATKVYGDFTHGSSSYNTVFRNFITRDSTPPEVPNITNARRAVDLEQANSFWNIVGNVLGKPSQTWDAYDPGTTRLAGSGQYVYTFGYFSDGTTTSVDPSVATSVYRHGNWDEQTHSVIWDSGNANHVLPDSLYLSSKPAFFGTCAWPAIGSDLSTLVATLPAKARFEGSSACAGTTGDTTPPTISITLLP